VHQSIQWQFTNQSLGHVCSFNSGIKPIGRTFSYSPLKGVALKGVASSTYLMGYLSCVLMEWNNLIFAFAFCFKKAEKEEALF
jgi:hypothetical protein